MEDLIRRLAEEALLWGLIPFYYTGIHSVNNKQL